uniref:Uncharacterized protein n=1 Tax=Cannabis sativa TaxID=3483 RepID=A0A803NFH8_CANSA
MGIFRRSGLDPTGQMPPLYLRSGLTRQAEESVSAGPNWAKKVSGRVGPPVYLKSSLTHQAEESVRAKPDRAKKYHRPDPDIPWK